MLYSNSCSESVLQVQKKKKKEREKMIDIRIFYSKLYIELMEVSKLSKIEKDFFQRKNSKLYGIIL